VATASVFDLAAEQIEQKTMLDRLQARGTLRIAVRDAGLDAKTVSAQALARVITTKLPHELQVRGVEDAEAVCLSIGELLLRAPKP